MNFRTYQIASFAFVLLFFSLAKSVHTSPLVRREPLPLRMLGQGEDGNGCTEAQMGQIDASLRIAREWAKDAAELFRDTDLKVLSESEGAKTWLSPDGTSPSGAAFPNKNEVPSDFKTKNDLKRDARMRFAHVHETFSADIEPIEKDIYTAFKDQKKEKSDMFLFICFPKETTEASEEYCDGSRFALTHPSHNYIILCSDFFADTGGNDEAEDQLEIIKKLVAADKEAYLKDKGQDGLGFPQPKSTGKFCYLFFLIISTNYSATTVFTLLHEAQHSQGLLQSTNEHDALYDIPNGHTLLVPRKCADEKEIKIEDRSRNPENWALTIFLIQMNKEAFLKKKTT